METVNTKATLEAMAKYICETNGSKPAKERNPLILIIGEEITVDGKEGFNTSVIASAGIAHEAAFIEAMLKSFIKSKINAGLPKSLAELLVLEMLKDATSKAMGVTLPDDDEEEE